MGRLVRATAAPRAGTAPIAAIALVGALLNAGVLVGAASGTEDPRILYMLECQGCHLADGRGSPPDVPALAGHVGKFLSVPRGREFLVRVPGSAQSPFSDVELAAVLNWIIETFGPGEVAKDFPPFRAEEVARHRSQPLTDVLGMRRELVRQIAGDAP